MFMITHFFSPTHDRICLKSLYPSLVRPNEKFYGLAYSYILFSPCGHSYTFIPPYTFFSLNKSSANKVVDADFSVTCQKMFFLHVSKYKCFYGVQETY